MRSSLETSRISAQEQRAERHVVIPDIHGEHKILERIVDTYIDDDDTHFVLLGDVLDRDGIVNDPEKGVFKTLEIIKNLGSRAIVAIGNHEWHFLASMYTATPDPNGTAIKRWLGKNDKDGPERNVLSAYDVDRGEKAPHEIIEELRRKMTQVGHLAILASTTPYYETDCFIATHAGVDSTVAWEAQREQLDETAAAINQGNFSERPDQWLSFDLAKSTALPFTQKIIVSGHDHEPKERVLHSGKVIRLASHLNPPHSPSSVCVWRDWDREIQHISVGAITAPTGRQNLHP